VRVSVLVIAALLLAGCGSGVDTSGADSPAPTGSPASPHQSSPGVHDPLSAAAIGRSALDLVGRWTVTGPDVPPGTSLYVADSMSVFLGCGVLDADWAADGPEGLFVASSSSGDDACFPADGLPALPWLTGASRFDVQAVDRVLTGADGTVLARLSPGPRVTPGPNRTDVYAAPPTATPTLQARTAEPAPLPDSEAAPTLEQLSGRWIPVGKQDANTFLDFAADGTYSGSDGCNSTGGRYALGRRGRLLATTGPTTAVGCDGAPVNVWMSDAARFGLQSGELVLHNTEGHVVGRLTR